MIYRLAIAGFTATTPNAAITIGSTPERSMLLTPDNTPQFKADITAGATLQDTTGVIMTSAQVTTFLSSLP